MRTILRSAAHWLAQFSGPWHAARLYAALLRRHGLKLGLRNIRRLPPGSFAPVNFAVFRNQRLSLEKSQRHGPIFISQNRRQTFVYLTDLALGRQLLTDHKSRLQSAGKPVSHLFSQGHLRAMSGDTHRYYRQRLLEAMRPQVLDTCEPELRAALQAGLHELRLQAGGQTVSSAQLLQCYRQLMTQLLLRVLLGVDQQQPRYARFAAAYARFSDGMAPAYQYGDEETRAYREIRSLVQALVTDTAAAATAPDCVLNRLDATALQDESVVGNLIYMLESGRFDLYSLLRWTTHYLTAEPTAAERLRRELVTAPEAAQRWSRAIVLETLRSNQSEEITRTVTTDIDFAGYHIPKGVMVRVCMWEAHKNPAHFSCPFQFNPGRFETADPALTVFAPFGVDHHRCIAGDYVVRLASIFVEELVRALRWQPESDGAAVRGRYHWEPSPAFAIRLEAAAP